MNFELPIGVRGHVADFEKVFIKNFLIENNLKFYTNNLGNLVLVSAVTKYGEVVIHKKDVITYLGKGKWDVRQEKKDE